MNCPRLLPRIWVTKLIAFETIICYVLQNLESLSVHSYQIQLLSVHLVHVFNASQPFARCLPKLRKKKPIKSAAPGLHLSSIGIVRIYSQCTRHHNLSITANNKTHLNLINLFMEMFNSFCASREKTNASNRINILVD